ncbi:hypothetical protein QC762_0059250 [Podospora pseudocomata]|uniref:NACHT domain-containing protein n=1 Tax=Podospora pseudocomata TaxID=2093779 RepID=A0ABR0GKP9_9PEZI|nr:hypothetical protein QC762_0059250 [Podospora pseudocomata]
MLPSQVEAARIFTCDWPADLLQPSDLVQKTDDEIALLLFEGIKRDLLRTHDKKKVDRPILFIASCLGGIILAKALVGADYKSSSYYSLRTATRGIIFLATPFGGTSFEDVAIWADPGLTVWALIRRRELVDMRSAILQIVLEPLPLDRTHRLMNKFDGPKCPDYKQVSGKILEFLTKICGHQDSQCALFAERLKIERLSGDLLPMDRCYINLAIVEWPSDNATHGGKGDTAQQSSPFSLLARLNVETPDKTIEVTLPTLFEPRKSQDGQKKQPSRILIRGRAGVGKTTLCKKIVHDFKYNNLWQGLFNRVLWVPLRNLKVEKRQSAGYNFRDLFYHEYFSQDLEGRELSEALWRALKDTKSGRTLLILDGFDEVSQGLGGDMSVFLEELLNQPNVIITARPNARLPPRLDPLDLELETIGFYPDQITAYIENTFTDRETRERDLEKIKEVQSFLQRHPLMQGLMRIPIQLDAFCYTWNGFPREGVPETMTAVYKAIEASLWKKDILKLQKKKDGEPLTGDQIKKASRKKIESFVEQELRFLECLAFLGFYDDVIDFDWELRNAVSDRFASDLLLDKDLPCLSFLRTSDPSSNDQDRNYHFLHLTFQEYFAARYFIRQWKDKQQLNCLQLSRDNCNNMEPATFLEKYKYDPRYDIFWRFVAGLLDADDMALDFFQMIEKEPRDLLGPTHQRLVMHCLSEVERKESNFTGLRARLENQLEQWLLFESDSTGNSKLVHEMECPGQVLSNVLTQASEGERTVLLESLSKRTAVPFNVIKVVFPWLTNRTSARQCAAILRMLGNQHNNLPDKIHQSIAARLKHENGSVREAAIEALRGRADLPNQVLQSIAARLEDKDRGVREAAIEALRGHAHLPDQVLQSIAARLEDKDGGVQWAAIEALGGRADLPDQVFQSIAVRLEDEDGGVRRAAMKALQGRADLPDQVLQSIAARLEDEDWHVQWKAIEVLLYQSALSLDVLIPHIRSFYDALLQESFREHLFWYASERSFIGTNLRHIYLTSEQHNGKEVVRKLLLEKGAANVNDRRRALLSILSY